MRVKDKVVLITGSGNGLGAAQAQLFAHEGARVIVSDVREDDGRSVALAIEASGGHACFLALDVTHEEDWSSVVGASVERFGRLDILVNNAGVSGSTAKDLLSLDDWQRLIDVHAKGIFLGMKQVIPEMKKSGGGAIVNISSTSAFRGLPEVHMGYNAGKAAGLLMTKAAAVQYGRDGIRVNSVHPGHMPPMVAMRDVKRDSSVSEKRLERIPLGRKGRVEEVAYAVLFLASDEASYITGTSLIVDGGVLARL